MYLNSLNFFPRVFLWGHFGKFITNELLSEELQKKRRNADSEENLRVLAVRDDELSKRR